jgi:hypothetical protein
VFSAVSPFHFTSLRGAVVSSEECKYYAVVAKPLAHHLLQHIGSYEPDNFDYVAKHAHRPPNWANSPTCNLSRLVDDFRVFPPKIPVVSLQSEPETTRVATVKSSMLGDIQHWTPNHSNCSDADCATCALLWCQRSMSTRDAMADQALTGVFHQSGPHSAPFRAQGYRLRTKRDFCARYTPMDPYARLKSQAASYPDTAGKKDAVTGESCRLVPDRVKCLVARRLHAGAARIRSDKYLPTSSPQHSSQPLHSGPEI